MKCYACNNEATQRCPRCGNPFCFEHSGVSSTGGPALCAACLSPASGVPSIVVFRGSLLALLVGSVLALWLLIRPPGLPGESGSALQPLPTLPPVFTPLPQPSPFPSPLAEASPTATGLLELTTTPVPAPSPPASPGFIEYTVQQDDTLVSIAEKFAPSGVNPFDFAQQIARLNDIDFFNPLIRPGQVLKIPQGQ